MTFFLCWGYFNVGVCIDLCVGPHVLVLWCVVCVCQFLCIMQYAQVYVRVCV